FILSLITYHNFFRGLSWLQALPPLRRQILATRLRLKRAPLCVYAAYTQARAIQNGEEGHGLESQCLGGHLRRRRGHAPVSVDASSLEAGRASGRQIPAR